jgi:hypothetical protein
MELCRNWHQNKSVFKTIPGFLPMSAKMWTAPNGRNWHQNKSVFKTIPGFLLMSAKMRTAPNSRNWHQNNRRVKKNVGSR